MYDNDNTTLTLYDIDSPLYVNHPPAQDPKTEHIAPAEVHSCQVLSLPFHLPLQVSLQLSPLAPFSSTFSWLLISHASR